MQCFHIESEDQGKILPDITEAKLRWETPLKVRGTIPAKSTGQSNILWNIPLKSEIPLENAIEHPLEYPLESAAEHPRRSLRCRFLVCKTINNDSNSNSDNNTITNSCTNTTTTTSNSISNSNIVIVIVIIIVIVIGIGIGIGIGIVIVRETVIMIVRVR